MLRSKHPTSHILIKANTCSDWDPVHFAVKEISPEWLISAQQRFMICRSFQHDRDFYCAAFWDGDFDFFSRPPKDSFLCKILDSIENWSFVVLEPGDVEAFIPLENQLDTHEMMITASGHLHFKALGKYTSEEYWTEEVKLADLLGL